MSSEDLNRREFVVAAGAMIASCGCAGNPGASAPHETAVVSPAKVVDVGVPTDYAGAGVYDRYVKTNRIILIRDGDLLLALEGTCSHKNCALKAAGTEVLCPCHGSRFDSTGRALRGPADVPLEHYSITLQVGRIIVDKTKNPSMNEPDSSIKLT